jgi:hypothetical protein
MQGGAHGGASWAQSERPGKIPRLLSGLRATEAYALHGANPPQTAALERLICLQQAIEALDAVIAEGVDQAAIPEPTGRWKVLK